MDRPVDDWPRAFSQTTVCEKSLTECCAITFLVGVEGRIGHDQPFKRASLYDGKRLVDSLDDVPAALATLTAISGVIPGGQGGGNGGKEVQQEDQTIIHGLKKTEDSGGHVVRCQ